MLVYTYSIIYVYIDVIGTLVQMNSYEWIPTHSYGPTTAEMLCA